MNIQTSELSTQERSLVKQFAKRKTFLFIYIISAVAFLSVYSLESESSTFLVDEYAKTGLSIIGVIAVLVMWKKDDIGGLKRTNWIGTVIALLILIFSIYAVIIESGHSDFAADDFPGIILGIFGLINGLA